MSLARPPFWSDVFFATTLREPRSATVACSPKVLCALRGTDPHALAASERSDVLRMLLSSATHSDPDGARMLERGAGMLAAGGGVSLREAGMMLPVCGADGGPQLYAACSGEGVGGVTAVLLGVFDALDRPKLRPLLDGCVAAAVLCGSASAAARDAATYGLTALLRISPSPDLSAGLVAALAALAQPRPGQCPFGAHLVLKACSSGRVADAAAAWRSYAAAIGVRGAAAAADPSALPDSAAVTLHRLSAPPPVRWAQARRAGSAEPESLVALAAIAATQLHKDGPPLAFHTEQACEAVWKCVEEADCGAATPQALYALLEAVRCSAATRDAVWDTDQSCADVGGLGAAVTGLLQSAAAASVHSAAALFALGAADDIAPLLLPPPARPRHADPAAAPDRGAGLAALRLLAPDRAAGLHLLLSSAPQPFPAPPPLSGASVARRLRAGARCCSALLQPLLAATLGGGEAPAALPATARRGSSAHARCSATGRAGRRCSRPPRTTPRRCGSSAWRRWRPSRQRTSALLSTSPEPRSAVGGRRRSCCGWYWRPPAPPCGRAARRWSPPPRT
eukprot:TRINITY_DN8266_c0_g1_i1.p1 TRINITY_DN8266_c0_g1~~TRINITY_DN8266_c0_g1_i1.p1  ORF type:complete len:567 (+),score=193.59 TRINITY_DN8266_c0_g1_i1:55-1755(+)